MRVLLSLLLLGAVFATPENTQTINVVQKVTELVKNAYETQDLNELGALCAGGSIQQFLNQFLQLIPPEAQAQVAAIFNGLGQCLNPMCGLVTSPCWTDLQSRLPTDNCVPTALTQSAQFLQTACANGCFTQLNSIAQSTAQCIANWAASNGGALGGLGNSFAPPDLGAAGASADLLCTQNPADALFCVTKLASSATLLVNAGNIADPANCPYFQSLGCCATGLSALLAVFNGTGAACGSAVAPFTVAQYNQALIACSLNNVPACPVIGSLAKIAVVQWAIDNINWAAFNALTAQQKLDFLAALRADFAAAVGLTPDLVSVGTILQTATGIVVKYIIRATTDVVTQAKYADYLAYITGSSTPSFSTTSTFAMAHSNLVVSGSSVQLNKASSSSEIQTQSGGGSGASSVVLSFATISFAILAMAFAVLFA